MRGEKIIINSKPVGYHKWSNICVIVILGGKVGMNRTKKIFFPKLKKITDLRSSEYPEQGKQINKQKYFQLHAEEGKGRR